MSGPWRVLAALAIGAALAAAATILIGVAGNGAIQATTEMGGVPWLIARTSPVRR